MWSDGRSGKGSVREVEMGSKVEEVRSDTCYREWAVPVVTQEEVRPRVSLSQNGRVWGSYP